MHASKRPAETSHARVRGNWEEMFVFLARLSLRQNCSVSDINEKRIGHYDQGQVKMIEEQFSLQESTQRWLYPTSPTGRPD